MTPPKSSRRGLLTLLWATCMSMYRPVISSPLIGSSGTGEPCCAFVSSKRRAYLSRFVQLQQTTQEPMSFFNGRIPKFRFSIDRPTKRQLSIITEGNDSMEQPLLIDFNSKKLAFCGMMPSCVTVITRPEQLLEFLEEDDRLCVVK